MYRIERVTQGDITVNIPFSKSETHRALILASLNRGNAIINNPLWCEDTLITREALEKMGAEITLLQEKNKIQINKKLGECKDSEIFLKDSGSSARFLFPLGFYCNKPVFFYGSERLHHRPMKKLFDILRDLGGQFEANGDYLPVKTFPSLLKGGRIKIEKIPSSQYITALLMASLIMEKDLTIDFAYEVPSFPYIKLTIEVMKRIGINVEWEGKTITTPAGLLNQDFIFTVGKDMSAASYWVAYAMIHESKIILQNVQLPSLQGDEQIFSIASDLGSKVMVYADRVEIEGKINKGMNVDCKDIPDLVPTLAVIAMFAPQKSILRNIGHLRFKESDRIEAIQKNIHALGGKSEYKDEALVIFPAKQYHGSKIHTFNDHRIAMSFAIAGTRIGEVLIDNPECVKKSYPSFWIDFTFYTELEKGKV